MCEVREQRVAFVGRQGQAAFHAHPFAFEFTDALHGPAELGVEPCGLCFPVVSFSGERCIQPGTCGQVELSLSRVNLGFEVWMAEGELLPDPGEPGDLGDGERFTAGDEALQSPLTPDAAVLMVMRIRRRLRLRPSTSLCKDLDLKTCVGECSTQQRLGRQGFTRPRAQPSACSLRQFPQGAAVDTG